MEDTPIVGYTGIMNFLYPSKDCGLSIYTITDQKRSVLILIPLTLGFSDKAYEIAKNTSFLKVFIVMPTINESMCSDLYVLMKRLLPLKGINNIAWVNPEKHAWDYEILYETQCCTKNLHLSQYGLFSYLEPFIRFLPSGIEKMNHDIYNIYLWDGISSKYFMNIIEVDSFIKVMKEKRVNEIHIPYQTSWFGVSGYDIIQQVAAVSSRYKKLIDENVRSRYRDLENYMYGEVSNFTITQILRMQQESKIKVLKDIIKNPEKLRMHSYTSIHILKEIKEHYNIIPGEMSDIETLR